MSDVCREKGMIAQRIIQYAWLIIAITGIAIGASIWLLPQLKTVVDFSSFSQKGDQEVAYYNTFTGKLGSNDHFIVVAIVPQRPVFDLAFLKQVDTFTKASGSYSRY